MEKIFHEKQEGSLCAQHCLNSLLQGHYFTAVDLADLGRQLDFAERGHLLKEDLGELPSGNVDDHGFFSVQVLSNALKVFNLELVPYNSEACKNVRQNPVEANAYICNHEQHWLSLRKIGLQWFNLDSLLASPRLVSDTYLSLLLEQLRQEGYSIFVVNGVLEQCEADVLLTKNPVTPKEAALFEKRHEDAPAPPHPSQPLEKDQKGQVPHVGCHQLQQVEDDYELALAISASLQEPKQE